jgi:CspA family cold shock protein
LYSNSLRHQLHESTSLSPSHFGTTYTSIVAEPTYRGTVKFFNQVKGWGGIESDETLGDVWVHFSAIEGEGYRELVGGESVEFRYEVAQQDSWNYRATWVRRITETP